MKVIALGGSGNMGRVAVRTLLDNDLVDGIVVADADSRRAESLIGELGDKRVTAERVDVADSAALARLFSRGDAVANSTGPFYRYGVPVLRAAIAAGLLLLSCGGCSEETTVKPSENVPGVSDTEILLGTRLPLSGTPAAAFGVLGNGMKAYFEYINSQGGINGRKIRLVTCDDQYSAPLAMECARQLVEGDKVFAIIGGLGDETELAVMDYLEERGIPDLFVSAGLPQFTVPVVKTRFAYVIAYDTESRIQAQYLKENYAGKRVGILYENNQAGKIGLDSLRKYLEGSDIELVSKQAYDPAQFDVTAQMQRLKQDNPDVVLLEANPAAAGSAIKASREVLSWDVQFIASGVSSLEITISLAGAENAEGTVSLTPGHMIQETDWPGVQFHRDIMKQFEPAVEPSSTTEYGMMIAEHTAQALKNAGPDLTRESVVEGAEQIRDFCCQTCILPTNLSPADHRVEEGLWWEKVENGQWVRFGDPVNFESTPGKAVGCKGPGDPLYSEEGR